MNLDSTMEYTITPSDDKTYITLKLKGSITRNEAMKTNIEAHALGKTININKFLVDVTEARNIDTVTDNYNFAHKDMANDERIDKFARVAALVSPGDHSHDFIETVAKNAGLNMKLFTDREEALKFLLHDRVR